MTIIWCNFWFGFPYLSSSYFSLPCLWNNANLAHGWLASNKWLFVELGEKETRILIVAQGNASPVGAEQTLLR